MTKLQELLKQINRKHVYIQTHNFPDPDAIASALGIQELLKHNGISSTICYKGKIDRYSTDKLRELMEIELLNVEDLSTILTDEDEVILVDAQKGNSNIVDITGDEIICIDHHPENEKFPYRFKDIRPEVGACATIVAQYFFENNIEVDFYVPSENLAIQVSMQVLGDVDTLERETRAFVKLNQFIPDTKCLLITNSEETTLKCDDIEIDMIPAWKWLLD